MEYDGKSARTYDNERRRIESWLGDYMLFHQDGSGKNVFLSVDSRRIPHNPLHKVFKTKSFTKRAVKPLPSSMGSVNFSIAKRKNKYYNGNILMKNDYPARIVA